MTAALSQLQTALRLLADPTRLRLVALLSAEELAVQELVGITGLGQSRISNHLALLKRAGLVRDRREGTWSFHRTVEPRLEGPLTPDLHLAVVQPFLRSETGVHDQSALERVREQRRARSREAHDRLAAHWPDVGQEFATGALRPEAYASLVPRGLVLADLGCGAGFLTEYLVRRGARVIAVDHSEAMLEAARRRVGEHAEFRRGEMDRLPLADGEVDAAFSNLVWHHLPSLEHAAHELRRVVCPGGHAIVTDLLPHAEEWMRAEMGDLRLGLEPAAVESALAGAGFTAIAREPLDDRYVVVSARGGRKAALPMFLVRATVPGASSADAVTNESGVQNGVPRRP